LRIILILEVIMKYKTERKAEILRFFKENSDRAYSIDELCRYILGESGGESSVYRIVSDYAKDGLIKRITDSGSRKNYYQYLGTSDCEGHLHLKCALCGRLIHLSHTLTSFLDEKIFASQGFSIDNQTTIFGTCDKCRLTNSKKEVDR
jgi:Fur family ferric uptake transcriptional regulator